MASDMTVDQVDSSKANFRIYRMLLLFPAILFALGAQLAIANGAVILGVIGYVAGVVCCVVGIQPNQCNSVLLPATIVYRIPIVRRRILAIASLLTGFGTFVLSGGNIYRPAGVFLWVISVVCWWFAWSTIQSISEAAPVHEHVKHAVSPMSRAAVLAIFLAILALGAAFRYVDLSNNPREMNSDHAEKLLDIGDVLNGTPHIFFERNTGREPWQFYWTVLLIQLFNLPADFMALKVGTSLVSLLMLPAIYLFAREVFGIRTALIAMLLAAIASWGVITSRFGLRYPLAPCAVAWTMYFLVRGLKRNERNTMLAAGVWIGIGLQGYTAYRFMVVVVPLVTLTWIIWLLVQKRVTLAYHALINGILAAVIAMLVLMPLLRYATERPELLFYRATTRLSSVEQPIKVNPAVIFADNLKNVLLMFNYTHDEVWVANLPDKPAMDEITGALLILGVFGSIALSVKERNAWPAIITTAGIFMLIPSALSLAFPRENPSVVRTGGALPMLIIACALIPGNLMNSIQLTLPGQEGDEISTMPSGIRALTWVTVISLCALSIAVNYKRVFVDYPAQYCPLAQNASDIAREMKTWVSAGNSGENAWLVGYPYWVDARAVGVWIGDIHFPNTIGASVGLNDVATVNLHDKPGWFALNVFDSESLQTLKTKYPNGHYQLIIGSQCIQKRFFVYITG
jgi:Dolichyl-phosphate-mannose-protein mannosyltransferase